MKPILEIRNLSKLYNIGHQKQGYLSLREQLANGLKNLGKKTYAKSDNTFWALKNISFDVHKGDSVGIIGKNGAGKSTLLKILSKITPPTEGYVKAFGRVASLLEVGTGFHPELSGRENIYLNGSILGLNKVEINRKFDEIVDFSGVERFLDTQLKHFSSGMQLRLAFSVAAHLEPEILVIDEVLAVGDVEFQQKCLGKRDEVSKSGRTILFVSHNMGAVRSLCNKALLLDNGILADQGKVEHVIERYLKNNLSQTWKSLDRNRPKGKGEKAKFLNINSAKECYFHGEEIRLHLDLNSNIKLDNLFIGLTVEDTFGTPIGGVLLSNYKFSLEQEKIHKLEIIISPNNLAPGKYFISIALAQNHRTEIIDQLNKISMLEILGSKGDKNPETLQWNSKWGNIVFNARQLERK